MFYIAVQQRSHHTPLFRMGVHAVTLQEAHYHTLIVLAQAVALLENATQGAECVRVEDAVLVVYVGGEEGRRWREGTAMVRRLWLVCVKVEVRETAVQRKEDSEGSAEDGVFGSSLS